MVNLKRIGLVGSGWLLHCMAVYAHRTETFSSTLAALSFIGALWLIKTCWKEAE